MAVGTNPTSAGTIRPPAPTGQPSPTHTRPANTGMPNSSALGSWPGHVFLSEGPADIRDEPSSLSPGFLHYPRHRDDIFRMLLPALPWATQTLAWEALFTLPDTSRNRGRRQYASRPPQHHTGAEQSLSTFREGPGPAFSMGKLWPLAPLQASVTPQSLQFWLLGARHSLCSFDCGPKFGFIKKLCLSFY